MDPLDIKAQLLARDTVDSPLPGGGHIHIERPLPFLCIYQQPAQRADEGTAELAKAQPSYVIAQEHSSGAGTPDKAFAAVVDALTEMFGGLLVLKIEAVPVSQVYDLAEGPPRAEFEILAPDTDAPTQAIEALQAALLEQSWIGGEPCIRICYERRGGQCDSEPLLPEPLRDRKDVSQLTLRLRAIYRSPEGRMLPLVLQGMRRSLTNALRQCFYAFSHSQAVHLPAHFHELGTQEIEDSAFVVDQGLADVADSFDLILDSTPVNSPAAWQAFQASGFEKVPEFHYRPLLHDPARLKRMLYAVPVETVGDPALHAIFVNKRAELDSQIDMLGSRCSRNYLYGSLQIYGEPNDAEMALSRDIVGKLEPRASGGAPSREVLTASEFAQMAEEELQHYRERSPSLAGRVELREDVPGILVSSGNFLIGNAITISPSRAAATIAHEVGTHVLTFHNGKAQPFQQFHAGMAGYEALQEGIAVLAEYLVGGLSSGRLRLLAGRVLAVDALINGADFVETSSMLHDDYGFGRRGAFNIAMRVHRSGGLTKDLLYLRGLVELLRLLEETDTPFEDLFLGKFALDHLELVSELKWRKILKPPALLPRYLEQKDSLERLARVREGLTPLDLIERPAS